MREDLKGELETGDHIYQTLLKDKEWNSENFLLKYKNHFNTQYIGGDILQNGIYNSNI